FGGEVEGLPGQEDFAADLAVGEPAATPPVAEFDEAAPFHAAAEDHHGVGDIGVMALDVRPGLFAGGDEGAGRGRVGGVAGHRLAGGRLIGSNDPQGGTVGIEAAAVSHELGFDDEASGEEPLVDVGGVEPEVLPGKGGDDLGGEALRHRVGGRVTYGVG